jgi:hypothetical protein
MTGTVTKYRLKNGRTSWGYMLDVGKDPKGKRRQQTKQGCTTKREAEDALREKIAELKKRPGGRDPRTFSELFDAWIREHCHRYCEATTTEGYLAKGALGKALSRRFADHKNHCTANPDRAE